MKLENPFSVTNKNKREIDYVKDVYKKRVQEEIDSYLDQDDKTDSIVIQHILYSDKLEI